MENERYGSLKKWEIVPVMGLIWALALLYGSGIGQTYDVYGKAKIVVLVLFAFRFFLTREIQIHKTATLIVVGVIVAIEIYAELTFGQNTWDYLWLYLLIPLIGTLPIEKPQMRIVALIYGGLGMAVLYIYNYGQAFKGWNPNSIAMVAFFSFAVMVAAMKRPTSRWEFLLLLVYYVVYYQWSEVLNSRSGILFTFLILLGILGVLRVQHWLRNKTVLLFILLIPLFVAVLLATIRNADFVVALEQWSQETFNKPIFNGRDAIFAQGFQTWLEHPFLGNGNLSAANWHNSAVTMLVGCGAVGFLIWIFGIRSVLLQGAPYVEDSVIYGLALGFLAIWMQQSVELGLVAAQANPIPYAMLGLLVGRVKTLRARENPERLGEHGHG